MKSPLILFIILFLHSAATVAQNASPSFTITGEVLKPLKLTVSDLQRMKPADTKAKDRDGKEHTYKGVRLLDLLDSAGVTLGKELRGENLVKYVLVKAVDGYEIIF